MSRRFLRNVPIGQARGPTTDVLASSIFVYIRIVSAVSLLALEGRVFVTFLEEVGASSASRL